MKLKEFIKYCKNKREEWYNQPEYLEGVNLRVKNKREIPRYCDICKENKSTEKFIGFNGNECYICSNCFGNFKK